MAHSLVPATNGNSSNDNQPQQQHLPTAMISCALSGVSPPTDPVISPHTGLVYERTLLLIHLQLNGNIEPNTEHTLDPSQLIAVNVSSTLRPRPPTATSIPSLLSLFQQEWDTLMLENYYLRQQLDGTRKELTQVLYQHDAAVRVISRLMKEKDELAQQLQTTQQSIQQAGLQQPATAPTPVGSKRRAEDESMQVESHIAAEPNADSTTLPEAAVTNITNYQAQIGKTRSKMVKAFKQNAVDLQTFKQFTELNAVALHSPTADGGIACLNVHPTNPSLLVTGGSDATAIVFDLQAQQIVHTLRQHQKAITSVNFLSSTKQSVITTSADHTANLYADDGKLQHTFNQHTQSIVAGDVHPTSQYAVTASTDATWHWHDLESLRTTNVVRSVEHPYTAAKFHPDGVLLGTANTDGNLRMWDVRSLTVAATMAFHADKHDQINHIVFNNNGYTVAASHRDGFINIYDLRKSDQGAIHSIELAKSSQIHALTYDESGLYLTAGVNNTISTFDSKTHDVVAEWSIAVQNQVNGAVVRLQPQQSGKPYMAVASSDRKLRIYGAKE